jgi:flagellar basal body-associated protein FliL
MADTYTDDTNRKSGKKLLSLLIGLILGLLLGGAFGYAIRNNSGTNSSSSTSSSSQSSDNSKNVVSVSAAGSTENRLGEYSQLLVEASRENVDTPSEEGTAAKGALDTATTNLVKSLGNNSKLSTDLKAINTSMLAYASTSRTSDEHADVDKAFNQLTTDLKSVYTVNDPAALQSHMTSVKNSLLEGVRDFVNKDYAGSYAKQLQAEQEMNQVFAELQTK